MQLAEPTRLALLLAAGLQAAGSWALLQKIQQASRMYESRDSSIDVAHSVCRPAAKRSKDPISKSCLLLAADMHYYLAGLILLACIALTSSFASSLRMMSSGTAEQPWKGVLPLYLVCKVLH
jgi:hypothetical protein